MIPRRFVGRQSTLLAAVSFENPKNSVVDQCVALCRRTGMSLRLIHVCEPWTLSGVAGVAGFPPGGIAAAAETFYLQEAEKKMHLLASSLPKEIDLTTFVVSGGVAREIIADATSTGAALIAVGTAFKRKRSFFGGLSTAVTLAAASPIPVLVLPETVAKPLGDHTAVALILADDLSKASTPAVRTCYELASALHAKTVDHVHVNGMLPADLEGLMKAAMATSHTETDPAMKTEQLMGLLQKQLRDQLEDRGQPYEEQLKAAGGHVQYSILQGRVGEQLHNLAQARNADLVVYGQHQTFHRKPFFVGRVPFHAMLEQERPFVIAPPAKETT